MRIKHLLPALIGGALAASDTVAEKVHAGKHSNQKKKIRSKPTSDQRKASKVKRKKRQAQRASRRRNRK